MDPDLDDNFRISFFIQIFAIRDCFKNIPDVSYLDVAETDEELLAVQTSSHANLCTTYRLHV